MVSQLSNKDDSLAEVLVAVIGDRVRYDHSKERWLIWDNVRWRPDMTQQMYPIIRDAVAALITKGGFGDEDQKHLASLYSSAKKESVMKALRADRRIAMKGDEWDKDGTLVGFDNGIVDLTTGKLLPPDPTNLVSKTVGCDYDENAKFPAHRKGVLSFPEFIRDIFGGDMDLVNYMVSFLGYALVGTTAEQTFWMWTGRGGNGKGVLARTLTYCFGDYAHTPKETLYMRTRYGASPSGSASPDLIRLQNVRFAAVSEPPGGQFDEPKLKAHTGQDTISARDLYSRSDEIAEFEPTHKIVVLTNDPPKTEDVGPSMARRVRIVKFERTYKPDGGKVEEYLKSQKPAIMALAVKMAGVWLGNRDLGMPDKVFEWSKEYIEDNDPIAEFLIERCIEDPLARTSGGHLWTTYEEWSRGRGGAIDRMDFYKMLKLKFDKAKVHGVMLYKGIRPKSADEMAQVAEEVAKEAVNA